MNIRHAVSALTLTAAGLTSLAVHEAFVSPAYQDSGGVWTYGFGSTRKPDGTPVKDGDKITPVAALELARKDLTVFEGAIKRCVTAPLSQKEFDVYTNLSYNIGSAAFCNSTLVRKLNAQDYAGACDAILMWKKVTIDGKKFDCSTSGNKQCAGLWARRKEAHAQCTAAQKDTETWQPEKPQPQEQPPQKSRSLWLGVLGALLWLTGGAALYHLWLRRREEKQLREEAQRVGLDE